METTNLIIQLPQEEKAKVAYALNLCAVSISQIIDSRDIIVLKQEREFILNNLNLQNFVKHPALLEVLKQILDTITYLEIQAGDLNFIEKEYQQKLKNAIWSAIPSPSALFVGGHPALVAIAVATQIGTGYMNYRRNKNQYLLERERSVWELKRHEIEQLYGLRAQLFETAWKLSSDYDFDDKYRLTQKQLTRYSGALLESDPLRRYERLDVMSDKFSAFPPFWYYKGNAAMEIFRSKQYSRFAAEYKEEAIKAYNEFHKKHFEFLREDVIAASCCLEHISLLEPNDVFTEVLLQQALRFAGDNYDVLQQSIFLNLQRGRFKEVIAPLREMIANNYNVGLNGILLSKIYFLQSSQLEYEKLRAIVGEENILPWSDDSELSEKLLMDARKSGLSDEYHSMVNRIIFKLKTRKSSIETSSIDNDFHAVSISILKYCRDSKELIEAFKGVESKLKQTVINTNDKTIRDFFESSQRVKAELWTANLSLQIAEDAPSLIEKMREVAKI